MSGEASNAPKGARERLAQLQEYIEAQHEHELVAIAPTYQPRTFLGYILVSLAQYAWYIFTTTIRVTLSLPWTLWRDPLGTFSMVFFAIAATAVLGLSLVFTVILRIPFVTELGRFLTGAGPDIGVANMGYPRIFDSLPQELRDFAYQSMLAKPSVGQSRDFDLDIAKMQLYVCALVYERKMDALLTVLELIKQKLREQGGKVSLAEAARGTQKGSIAGVRRLDDVCGGDYERARSLVRDADSFIRATARQKLGLEYIALSELSTDTSAVCGMFFDPNLETPLIILAFKGTTPASFSEWLIDFTYQYTWAGKQIPGFHFVHNGFFSQLFRSEGVGNERAYNVIRNAVQHTADAIRQTSGASEVNLWVTGHSLGAATGTLFYSKTLTEPMNGVVLRDGYFYGAPIVGDPSSVASFNKSVTISQSVAPSVWRVLNDGDAVATMLPSLGDNRKLGAELSRTNQFNFAHFGQLAKLQTLPRLCRFGPGTLYPRFESIEITSDAGGRGTGPDVHLPLVSRIGEAIPLIGRLVSHGPSWYWARLSRVGTTLPGVTVASR